MKFAFLDFVLLLACVLYVTQIFIPFLCRQFGYEIQNFWLFRRGTVLDKVKELVSKKEQAEKLKIEVKTDIEKKAQEVKDLQEKTGNL